MSKSAGLALFTHGNNPGTNYSISSAGAIDLPPDAVGCSASGTAVPHTDKNVFDISLQFSGTRCALGNRAQVFGIAVVGNDGHLLMMGATPDIQDQFIYVVAPAKFTQALQAPST